MITDVTVQFLELAREDFKPKRSSKAGVAFSRVDPPMPEINRFFYTAIGGNWFWLERRRWTVAQWMEWLGRGDVETWMLSVDGVPAGFCELVRKEGDVEVK